MMGFIKKMWEKIDFKYQNPSIKDVRREYGWLGSDLIDEALKDMEDCELISISRSNGRIRKLNKGSVLK